MFKRIRFLWLLSSQPELFKFLQWLYLHEENIVAVLNTLKEKPSKNRTMWD